MAFDAIVTMAIAKELSDYLTGGKVEKIYQPEADELVFFIHGSKGRVKVYASSNSSHPGVYLTDLSFENPASPPNFCMLMRKHIQSSKIVSVAIKDTERIIEMIFESKDEMGYNRNKKLIIEIMGRHSNIILVDTQTGKIIDSIKRISLDESRARQVFPGQVYAYPPAQNKIPFNKITEKEISQFIGSEENIDEKLLSHIGGISPSVARKIAEAKTPGKIYDELMQITASIAQNEIYPAVYINESSVPKDFHVLKLPEYENRFSKIEFDSISKCIQWYYSHREESNRIKQKSQNLIKSVSKDRKSVV